MGRLSELYHGKIYTQRTISDNVISTCSLVLSDLALLSKFEIFVSSKVTLLYLVLINAIFVWAEENTETI